MQMIPSIASQLGKQLTNSLAGEGSEAAYCMYAVDQCVCVSFFIGWGKDCFVSFSFVYKYSYIILFFWSVTAGFVQGNFKHLA